MDAKPLLSPLISLFVLFMDVQWTGNQVIAPSGLPEDPTNFMSCTVLSTLNWYLLVTDVIEFLQLEKGELTCFSLAVDQPGKPKGCD